MFGELRGDAVSIRPNATRLRIANTTFRMVAASSSRRQTGQTPRQPDRNQWGHVFDRSLFARLTEEFVFAPSVLVATADVFCRAQKQGVDIQRLNADLHQGRRIGLFGVPTSLRRKLAGLCAFDFDPRPHTDQAGGDPIGEPPQHARLAGRLELLSKLVVALRREADKQLGMFERGKTSRVVMKAWLDRAQLMRLNFYFVFLVYEKEYGKLKKGAKGSCKCSVCLRIERAIKDTTERLRDFPYVSPLR